MTRARQPVFHPCEACGLTRLLAKMVAAIAKRTQQHFRRALWLNFSGYTGIRNRALEHTAGERYTVGNSCRGFMEVGIGCYRSRIEKAKAVITKRMGRKVKARGNCLFGRDNRVDLSKRIHCSEPGLVFRKKKGSY